MLPKFPQRRFESAKLRGDVLTMVGGPMHEDQDHD